MKKIISALLLAVFLAVNTACQNQQNKMIENQNTLPKFEWVENLNCPPGYPIEVYRGGLDGNVYVSLSKGTSTGIRGWGASGAGTSYGLKPLPSRINCIWVSYAEGCLYSIDSPIDYDKMLKLFQEGYQDSGSFFNDNGAYEKRTFTTILTGFAPGGVVVIWAMGPARQVEIGRYKGEKYVVPQEEIATLDAHESLLFSKKEYQRIMQNPKIVPPEVREAHAGKPIPFGLWDSYRVWHNWRPIFSHNKEIEITSVFWDMFNGEYEKIFDKTLQENKFTKRGIPKSAHLTWTDWTENSRLAEQGQGHAADVILDEEEIIQAYKEMYTDSEEKAELQFTISYTSNFITVQLKRGDHEIRLVKTKVNAYKTKNLSLRK